MIMKSILLMIFIVLTNILFAQEYQNLNRVYYVNFSDLNKGKLEIRRYLNFDLNQEWLSVEKNAIRFSKDEDIEKSEAERSPSILGQAQEKECALTQPDEVPKDFFNSENYTFSYSYDSVCTPYRWLSLFGDHDNCSTSSGGFQFGTYIEFGADGRLCIFRGAGEFQKLPVLDICGDYKLDSSNGLLYIHWDKSNDSFYQEDFVCQICYYMAKESGERYKESLRLNRYIEATWDMSLEKIKECRTTPLFETFVRHDHRIEIVAK